MRVKAFETTEPLPELREPHAIAMMRPWVDVGSVGTTVLGRLEKYLNASELAKLAEPGRFFDFTRYRPMLRYVNGEREVTIPNTFINYSRAEGLPDLLFVHLLEPHSLGEEYIDSVLELFKELGVTRYLLVGGMYRRRAAYAASADLGVAEDGGDRRDAGGAIQGQEEHLRRPDEYPLQ